MGRRGYSGYGALEADRATMERTLDTIVCQAPAQRDGSSEIGMAAAPAFTGRAVDLEEIGDVGGLGAQLAELADLGGIFAAIGWDGRGVIAWRNFPVIGAITGKFLFLAGPIGAFRAIFRRLIMMLFANSLIMRNREFSGAEQGIGLAGTMYSRRAVRAAVARHCAARPGDGPAKRRAE